MTGPRLKDLGRWYSGGTPPSDRQQYWNGDIPWLSGKDFDRTSLREPTRFIAADGVRLFSRRMPAGRSILVLVRGMALTHGLPVVRLPFEAAINQDVRGLVVSHSFDPGFIYYALLGRRAELEIHVDRAAHGTARARDSLYGHRISWMPSVLEQRRIAAFLERECERIDAAIRVVDRVPGVLREAFVEERKSLLSSAVGDTRIGRITTCLDRRRVPLNSEQRAMRAGPYPYWGANAIQGYVDDYLFDEVLLLIGEDGAPFFDPRREVAWVVSGRCWVNNHAHVLRCHPGWSAEYIAHVLNATDFRRYITGATRDKLTQDDMNSISVPVMAYDEQLAVAKQLAQVAHWHERTAHFGALLAQDLASYRSSLVHEAVTGRLDVSRVSESEMDERLHAAAEGRLDEVAA